jgi:SAM-dependent methyltransferase
VEHLLRATAKAEARHFWFRGFRAFVTPLLDDAAAGRSDLQLLDCGCGTGANLDLLGRYGRAYGFDLSDTGLRIGREAGRTRLARASVTAAPFPDGSFDVVTSFDVLYSLEEADERAAIAEMFRLLKPGGFAVVNVAAMRALRGDHSVLSHELRRYGLKMEHESGAQREISVPPAPVNGLLTGVMLLESAWLRWFDLPFGSSLLCLARKPRASHPEI